MIDSLDGSGRIKDQSSLPWTDSGPIRGRPYLTVVVTARNDDHGGDLLRRMQVFVNMIRAQSARSGLGTELIVVEWNPPPGKRSLYEALEWPDSLGTQCMVKFIVVSHLIHSQFLNSDRIPLFQMIGKNVGIRRSRGKFVLSTNVDVLFSNELIDFIARRKLQENRFYRIDRHDVSSEIPYEGSLDEQLRFCSDNVLSIYMRDRTDNLSGDEVEDVLGPAPNLPRAARVVPSRLKQSSAYQTIAARELRRRQLHLNASGDFTLLASEKWTALKGYPELEVFSMHLDSLFCHIAFHSGLRERILRDPLRVYHLEHRSGWDAAARSGKFLDSRLDPRVTPQLTYDQLVEWAMKMRSERRPLIFNHDGWGLAKAGLEEVDIVHGSEPNRNSPGATSD